MASLIRSNRANEPSFRVQFMPVGSSQYDSRVSISIGRRTEEDAGKFLENLEHMIERLKEGRPYDKPTRNWLEALDDRTTNKLASFGFCEARSKPQAEASVSLSELCNRFLVANASKKALTRTKLKQAGESLMLYPAFGPNKAIRDITPGLAEEWRAWIALEGNRREGRRKPAEGETVRKDLSDNTVRRRTGMAKQIFAFAVRHRWIQENPFAGLVCTVNANPDRMRFIDRATTIKAIESAPDANWRAIIALARFAGVRVPSEIARLTWQDIDFEAGRIRVHASKTEHHKGHGIRYCPLFPELRPYLEDLATIAKPGIETTLTTCVIPGCHKAVNLRTRFEAIIRRAGLEQWPKLFQNLRASRETELLSSFPAKDVCQWLGNSEPVAMKHYAMATESSFSRAILEPTGPQECTQSPKGVQKNVQSEDIPPNPALSRQPAFEQLERDFPGKSIEGLENKPHQEKGKLVENRPGGIRTPDQGIMSPLLSPLSYGPVKRHERLFGTASSRRIILP